MDVIGQAQALAAAGRTGEAVALVEAKAAEHDPAALHQLALWRLLGTVVPRDLPLAHRLLDRAAAKRHVDSIRLKAMLVGNGTGCRRDPRSADRMLRKIKADPYAAAQLAMLARMAPPASALDIPAEALSERPLVKAVRGLLTAEECRYLTILAGPQLQPSVVQDPATGRRIPHPVRTSSGMSFGPMLEDRVVNAINRRLAAVTGTEIGCGEPLHILNYAPGQQYRMHVDYLPGTGNQRSWTVLVYLNEGYQGGETRLDLAGVTFAGRTGDALIFRNIDEQGEPDPATRHAGLPVTAGTKWLATRWIRQRPYHPWDPATA